LLARVGVATGPEEIQPVRDPLEDLGGCEHADPRGGKLDGQRQVVHSTADLANGLLGLGDNGALGKEGDGVLVRQRLDLVLVLAVDSQRRARRDQQAEVRAPLKQPRERRGGVEQMLEVVSHDQGSRVRYALRWPDI
jgi:hypothetical protein